MENEKKRRVFIGVNDQGLTVIKRAIEAVGELTNEIVNDSDEADLVITTSSREALVMLKETDEAKVMVFVLPGMAMSSELVAARSLRETFPNRVVIGRLFDPDIDKGEVLMVDYLLMILDEKVEEKRE